LQVVLQSNTWGVAEPCRHNLNRVLGGEFRYSCGPQIVEQSGPRLKSSAWATPQFEILSVNRRAHIRTGFSTRHEDGGNRQAIRFSAWVSLHVTSPYHDDRLSRKRSLVIAVG
jgi:hypothetical protein